MVPHDFGKRDLEQAGQARQMKWPCSGVPRPGHGSYHEFSHGTYRKTHDCMQALLYSR